MDKELATIKPSEHLELIVYRLRDIAGEVPSEYLDMIDHEIIGELERLRKYLRETGQ